MGQRQAAQDQADYQAQQVKERDRQIAENYKRAMAAYNLQTIAEGARMEEVRAIASQKAFEVSQQVAQAKARVISNAASTGAGGNSLLAALQDILRAGGYQTSILQANLRSEQGQSRRNLEAYHQEAANRISSIQPFTPSSIRGPSLIGPALTIAGAGLGAYADHRRDQRIEQLTTQ